MRSLHFVLIGLLIASFYVIPTSVEAHQPYCEVEDLDFANPMSIEDPTISLALYATLDASEDVDYFAFTGEAGDKVLLGLTIPQIVGQDLFAPQFALLGPSLEYSLEDLPAKIETGNYETMVTIPVQDGETDSFFEPFSFTRYWERQETTVELPSDGNYLIAVWSPVDELGRYVMIVGSKERLGGDYNCYNENDYWTPVQASGYDHSESEHEHLIEHKLRF